MYPQCLGLWYDLKKKYMFWELLDMRTCSSTKSMGKTYMFWSLWVWDSFDLSAVWEAILPQTGRPGVCQGWVGIGVFCSSNSLLQMPSRLQRHTLDWSQSRCKVDTYFVVRQGGMGKTPTQIDVGCLMLRCCGSSTSIWTGCIANIKGCDQSLLGSVLSYLTIYKMSHLGTEVENMAVIFANIKRRYAEAQTSTRFSSIVPNMYKHAPFPLLRGKAAEIKDLIPIMAIVAIDYLDPTSEYDELVLKLLKTSAYADQLLYENQDSFFLAGGAFGELQGQHCAIQHSFGGTWSKISCSCCCPLELYCEESYVISHRRPSSFAESCSDLELRGRELFGSNSPTNSIMQD